MTTNAADIVHGCGVIAALNFSGKLAGFGCESDSSLTDGPILRIREAIGKGLPLAGLRVKAEWNAGRSFAEI